MDMKDYGPKPYVVDIEELTANNDKFRVAKWTGSNLQMTVMSVASEGEVGLEVHEDRDQFLSVMRGTARVEMGDSEENLTLKREVGEDFAVFVPAGTWHNIINTGDEPLKMYSIYAPPEHEHSTVHDAFEDDPEH